MFFHNNKETISWIILISILLLIMDFTIFNPGLIFLLIIAIVFLYVGKKILHVFLGKIFFWLGILFLIITVINLFVFRILLFGLLIFAIYQFTQTRKNPTVVQPEVTMNDSNATGSKIIRKTSLLRNFLFGNQSSSTNVYEWNDVNIQTGIGDTVIDLSNTVLPEGIAVISIRGFIGNVQILIPYEQEVSVHHSVLSGSLTVFDFQEKNVMNKTIYVQTEHFDETANKIKIITSMVIGNVEVKRI
ncbi:cell wall-active antibiotics response protein LiaF [Caldibacillus lycopersici]|uniref:Cell wall-active antibiotics response protein LiaF n=1 Tax=Perspicuibacillus lycopersici TaxID=1325689 RepID=A0AAE3IU21_9BACI|nr:cell wall-active antibiotics response protein LiaF [Perspicuibacillus lycopersici]MCU9614491.1 cell wall-active antibiotics response protein LiaF [Perspicuibacillus lycopersici]